ncbi:MAG: type IX secretion system sortase PorU [Muribaculaceae bacterium]|nr:type IX secretion system sortase PorU [Muribaculaceae bacterium]
MKVTIRKPNAHILSMILIGVALLLLISLNANALPATHYADNSVLSTGRWARVKVSTSGMHLITDTELRNLGFSDPSKVRVYGRGGKQCTPGYTTGTPDDLPLQPSVRTQKGIVFFASDHISWEEDRSDDSYKHSIHAYSHDNYYFLSDRENKTPEKTASTTKGGGTIVRSFLERLLHEEELDFGGESGSQIFGEDFRSKRSQTFNFKRIDSADDNNMIKVRFGAKVTNGSSSLVIKANGATLPKTASDVIASCSTDYYFKAGETKKNFKDGGENLAITIDYSQTGTLFMARLDYIEIYYNRKLSLRDGELHFYGSFSPSETLTISGCSPTTVIWDVTDASSPAKVEYELSGNDARFGVSTEGYHEFVAFEPERISRNATSDGAVANQNLHGLPTPDMVIITLPEYREGSERIARLHEETDGFRVHVLNAQEIYNEFSGGKPDFGAFRNLLKMWYDRGADKEGHRLGYCLLMGRPFYDNKRVSASGKNIGYNPLPIYESYEGEWEHASYSTDDYLAKLDDVSDKTFSMSSGMLRVAVGRYPVTSSTQAIEMAQKLEKYVKEPDMGAWRNKVMLIADDDDRNDHFNQAQSVYSLMKGNGTGDRRVYDRVYLDTYKRVMTGIGPTYPQATERMLRNYNDGVAITDYIGHGSPVGWCHEHLWDWEDIISMTNKRHMFIISATCRFSPWDESSESGGEKLLLNPTAGAIGLISTSRTVYVGDNGNLNNGFAREFFKTNEDGSPRRFGDVYMAGKNAVRTSNTLRFIYMGDPALKIPGGSSKVKVNKINGTDLTLSDTTLPELTAQSSATIEGVVELPDGSIDKAFNGTVTLDLYDAERVITTLGQGATGYPTSYNDRDKRLSTATMKVKEGVWSGVLRVPPEIQGNYTPAMIAGYAWDERGHEAAGTCEQLYVYGFNHQIEADTVPPVIEEFYVNSPNFENGGVVNSNPVIYARITDESGINISDSGIGHSMTLTIDDNKVISGLNTYFEQDPENPDTGMLIFPASNLESGKHQLTLTVWDNANNMSKAKLDVNVGVAVEPTIYGITASIRDTHVDFNINLDRPNSSLAFEYGVFDLNGRRIWSEEQSVNTGMDSSVSARWNLEDSAGNRVPRGIYIYRVRVETPEGTYSTESKKIAIPAAK